MTRVLYTAFDLVSSPKGANTHITYVIRGLVGAGMAAGRPLVAANLPVVRELAREEVDALLFAPGDPYDLARQLGRVLAARWPSG